MFRHVEDPSHKSTADFHGVQNAPFGKFRMQDGDWLLGEADLRYDALAVEILWLAVRCTHSGKVRPPRIQDDVPESRMRIVSLEMLVVLDDAASAFAKLAKPVKFLVVEVLDECRVPS
jgi:hypothetical protein